MMNCPEALKHVRTIDLRNQAQIRAGTGRAAVITSDGVAVWQDDYVKTGLPAGLEARCRVLDNDSYCNTGSDWLINPAGEDDDEFVFNFYGFEGEDWLENIKRRALAVLDKSIPVRYGDDTERSCDEICEGEDSFDADRDDPALFSGTLRSGRPDFSGVDWSLSNAEIARQLDVTASAVYYQRKQRQPDTIVQKRKIDYKNIDWSLSNLELAGQYNVSTDYISYQRKLRSTYTGTEKSRNIDYTQIDWSQTDVAIARRFGVQRRTISRQRKKRGSSKEITIVTDQCEDIDREEGNVENVKKVGIISHTILVRKNRQKNNPTKILKEKIDYSHADWSQPDKILAQQLGVTQDTISRQRRKRGIGAAKDKYTDLDWAQTNAHIARHIGVAPATVWYQRMKRNIKPAGRRGKVDYSLADWSQADRIIAQQLGVTQDTVARQRRRRGQAAANDKYADVDWTQTNKEIARQVGVTSSAVLYQRKKRKIKPAGKSWKIDYSHVDWSQTNTQLAQLLGITPKTIVRQRRRRGIAAVKNKEDRYADVDWSQNNREIAQQFGVTPRAIAYQRKHRMISGNPCFLQRPDVSDTVHARAADSGYLLFSLVRQSKIFL